MTYQLVENTVNGQLENVQIVSEIAGVVCTIPMPHALSLGVYVAAQQERNPEAVDSLLFGYSQGIMTMQLIQMGYVDTSQCETPTEPRQAVSYRDCRFCHGDPTKCASVPKASCPALSVNERAET